MNGLLVNSTNVSMATDTTPNTPAMCRACVASRFARLRSAATVQPARISVHSSMEPSCPPQTAAMRKATGKSRLLCCTTYTSVKSFWTNATARATNAANSPRACKSMAARCKRAGACGNKPATPWHSAATSASTNAK